jgi:hypothetical protein
MKNNIIAALAQIQRLQKELAAEKRRTRELERGRPLGP